MSFLRRDCDLIPWSGAVNLLAGGGLTKQYDDVTIEVRAAAVRDLDAMVSLIATRRAAYERFQPVLWRLAAGASQRTKLFYRFLLWRRSSTMLVASIEKEIAGFLIATVTTAPPVYDPGGATATIDDFVVASPDWSTVGNALLSEARRIGRKAGWCQIVVICGAQDEAKTTFLQSTDLSLASTWWTAET